MLKQNLSLITSTVVSILAGTMAFASEPEQRTNTNSLWFESWGTLSNATLTIAGPEGVQTSVYNKSGSPTFYLRDISPVADGVYSYELTAATDEKVKIKSELNNGRGDAAQKEMAKPFHMTGSFIVSRGVIALKEELVEE
jgi:hypothetical protein